MTKGKSLRGCHLIITGRASILILIITSIVILISGSLWRRIWKGSETTKMSLSLCYTTDTGVHLTHLINERFKASIHVLKLCYDGLQGHTSYRSGKSKGGRSRRRRSCRIYMISCLYPWLLWLKLGLALSNRTGIDGTHNGEVRRVRNRDGEMVKDLHDSWRKDELITGRHILVDIEDRSDEMKREINREVLKKGQKKASMRLSDRVIVRQWSKSKCHHHVKESRAFGKAWAWDVLLLYGRCLTKVRQKLVSRHSPKMLTTGVVRMHYLRNV